MNEYHLCPECASDFIMVKLRSKNKAEKVCPKCTKLNPNNFKQEINGVFYEKSLAERAIYWVQDKPVRWLKRVTFKRF